MPTPLVGNLSSDLSTVRNAVMEAPKPRGGVNMSAAVREAILLLKASGKQQRDIIVLTDGQRHGWADPKVARTLGTACGRHSRGRYAESVGRECCPRSAADLPNWSLSPIQSSRPWPPLGEK